jgi:tryptophan synthase beta chain
MLTPGPSFGRRDPDARGYFGAYGGRFVPETLVAPIEELERAYFKARKDEAFRATLNGLLTNYVGRPTPLYEATRLEHAWGGAKIFLKREDLAHTGAHKINNAIGQARCSASTAASTWDRKTWRGRNRTSFACAC